MKKGELTIHLGLTASVISSVLDNRRYNAPIPRIQFLVLLSLSVLMVLTVRPLIGSITKEGIVRKVLVLVCVFALLASAAVLVGCGSGSSAQTPEQVMQAFWAAAKTQDTNGSWNMLSTDSQKKLKDKTAWAAAIKSSASSTAKIGKVTINGNTATVEVTVSGTSGQGQTTIMPLIKENGVWKVDMVKGLK